VNDAVNLLVEGKFPPLLWHFYNAAWRHRHQPNVHLQHFTELKKNPARSVLELAHFLGKELGPQDLEKVLKHCSFEWMKEHEDKFNITTIGFRGTDGSLITPLEPKVMLRSGRVGEHEGVLTHEQRRRIYESARACIEDPECLQWLFHDEK
jgi:hypothetical protein